MHSITFFRTNFIVLFYIMLKVIKPQEFLNLVSEKLFSVQVRMRHIILLKLFLYHLKFLMITLCEYFEGKKMYIYNVYSITL